MKRWKWFVILLLFWMLLSTASYAEWYVFTIHAHTDYSDGNSRMVDVCNKANKRGCQGIIITDHSDQIKDYLAYINDCLSQKNIFCIPGIEISTKRENPDRSAHTLALGLMKEDEILKSLQTKPNQQNAIVDRIRKLGCPAVAAHPNLQGVQGDFRYDLDAYQSYPAVDNPMGFEMFNIANDKPQEQPDLVKYYVNLVSKGLPVFVTSGCDIHKIWPTEQIIEFKMWGHQTHIFADRLDQESILQAIKNGRTYAANNYARFDDLSYVPSFDTQKVERPRFSFSLGFSNVPTSSPMTSVNIYRDGKLVTSSVKTMAITSKYDWEDKDVSTGKHIYIIEVGDYLVTSPIILQVNREPEQEQTVNNQNYECVIEKELHHLGNNKYNTPVNVGFVKPQGAEGISWSKKFTMPDGFGQRSDGYIVMNIRGAEGSSLYLNDIYIGRLENTLENNGLAQAYKIPKGIIYNGLNSIRLVSNLVYSGFSDIYSGAIPDNDDYEFHELTIFFGNISPYVK